MKARLLIVDDEASLREFLSIALTRMGYRVDTAESGEEGLRLAGEHTYEVVLTDIRMPEGINGIELLTRLRQEHPETLVLLMTAYASVDTAIKAVQLGALDYVIKPFKIDEIKMRIERALEQHRLLRENRYLRNTLRPLMEPTGIQGDSAPVEAVRQMIARVAPTPSTVLITGESGTGKELVARALHEASLRQDGPFVSVNCGALPEGLLESELFGHMRGAFTGAVKDKAGLFQVADGGSLFLDEVSETSPAIQVKLLRALQEREVVPVGGTEPLPVDVRLIAATNASLEERVAVGSFREDLFYRLNVVPIHLPPLRDRREDIPLLANHFLERFGKPEWSISKPALDRMMAHDWPGNVRELENAIERAVILSEGSPIEPESLPAAVTGRAVAPLGALPPNVPPTLETIEKAYILYVLEQTGGVKTAAAELLGIDPSTLHRKIDRYGLRINAEQERAEA